MADKMNECLINNNYQSTESVKEHKSGLEYKKQENAREYKWEIFWNVVIVIAIMHIAAIYGLYLRWTTKSILGASIFAKAFIIFAGIGTTAGNHRLWAHRTYKANKKLQWLLMFMSSLSYQKSVYLWCRDHRLHHKCSDTDADPHNSKRGFFFSHIGWLMIQKQPEVFEERKNLDLSDLEANPIVMFQHKYYYPIVVFCTFVFPTVITVYLGATWSQAFFIVGILRFVLILNVVMCINSVAHIYGNRPYDKNIIPTDSPAMKYLNFGEGFHNYHHTFPWDYKAAEFGNDVRNLTAYFIEFCAWLGWATDLRTVTPEMVEQRSLRTGGPGREIQMKLDNSNRFVNNLKSFLIIAICYYVM